MFQTQENELRLVWFFTPLFLGFILIGKKYGLYSLLFIYVSTFLFEKYIGFGYSKLALSTFYSSITLFSLFTYAFLYKIDKDEKEFKVLNNELQDKVLYEVEQRQEQEKMLLRQCRMANMGEMIDAIAHQWRQPLMSINAVLMNLGVLAEDKKEHQELKEGIDEIASLTSHMSQTINDFRTLYQIEKQKSFFSIDTLLKDINELMKNNLQDIHLEVHGDDNVEIYSYKSELTQVLITLLSNAIEVLHSRNIVDKKIYIAYYQRGKYLFIEVEDNAGGVVESNLSKVFDPYFTTKKQSGGTGLGLYITQIIIEHNMYGTISVRNTKEGAKFLIKLPK
jgi:signal transduction histidine kinase